MTQTGITYSTKCVRTAEGEQDLRLLQAFHSDEEVSLMLSQAASKLQAAAIDFHNERFLEAIGADALSAEFVNED